MLWTDENLATHPAVDTSGRDLPTRGGELFSAAFARNDAFAQNITGEHDRLDALGDYLDAIKRRGGPDIAPELDYGTMGGGLMMPDSRALLQQANDKLAQFKQKNPTFDQEPLSPEQFEQNAVNKRRQADADYQELVDRPMGRGAAVGLVGGTLSAGAVAPSSVEMMAVAPAESVGVLASALRWGVVGAGTQAVQTAIEAPYRAQVEPGYVASGQPLVDIAAAGLEAGAAGGVLRGAANVWERLRTGAWPTTIRDAGNVVSSQANVAQSNIYPGAAGAVAHEQALSKAADDAETRRPVDVSNHITPAVEASLDPFWQQVETMRQQAQAVTAEAARLRAAAPAAPVPELPFERTAAEAEADRFRQQVTNGVQAMAGNAGYAMPAEEAARVADKFINAEPGEAQDLLRNLHMSPRQVADAPARLEPPAEPIATPVPPIDDIHAPEFQDALRADLDRELVSSEGGMPSRAASEAETGLPAPGISSSGVTLPTPSTQPLPGSQISRRPEPLGSLITRATTPPETLVGPMNTLGTVDEASHRHILQGSNDLNRLREAATANKPLADARLAELVAEVPGIEYHGARVKTLKGLQGKVDEGRPPNTISDYLGSRVIAETPDALRAFVQKIQDTGSIVEHEDFLDPGKEGYRAVHLQVGMGDGTTMELQVVPRPIADVQNQAHDLRDPVKRLDLTDPNNYKLYQQEMAKGREILDKAWSGAKGWEGLRPGLAEIDKRPMPAALPETHSRYFNIDDLTSTVPIDHLLSSKSEADNARSGPNAAKRMEASSRGELERRRPITVAPLPDGRFLIKDGNATFTAAKQYGWKALPVHIRPEPGLRPREHALPNGVAMFSPGELGVDAERFQFKGGTDEAGVSERLKGVKNWDPIKAGMVLTWVDKDGKAWIVDGHQRLALAKRIAAEDPAQNPQLLARTLKETDGITPAHARAIAAMKNIAEGTGTAVDAAKVIRDHPKLAEDLPPRSELVHQARGLVNLSDEAFGMVVNEVVPANYAAIVGRLAPADPAKQTALLNLLAKTDPANAVQAEAIVRQGIEAGFAKANASAQTSLFGEQEVAESLYSERAKVLDRALKTLRRDKTVFNTLVKEQQTLAEAGNVLAHDINQQRATADGQALQILQTLANRAGPISDALRTAARTAKSDGYAAATRDFVETVREAASSGDLARLANGIERGASHVGDQGAAGIIDHGIAAEPSEPAKAERAEQQIKPMFEMATAISDEAVEGLGAAVKLIKEGIASGKLRYATEPGAEGLPQGIMPGMEPSAQQLAAARAGPLRPGVAQAPPGGLFSRPEELPDMFPVAAEGERGAVSYQSVNQALTELDQYKLAAQQLAACGSPVEAG